MSNIFPINRADVLGDHYFEIERNEAFFDSAEQVSKYLKTLPLTTEQNDKLVELMINHVNAAEKSGFDFGVKLTKDMLNFLKEDTEHDKGFLHKTN